MHEISCAIACGISVPFRAHSIANEQVRIFRCCNKPVTGQAISTEGDGSTAMSYPYRHRRDAMLYLNELYGKPSDLAPITKLSSVMEHFRMKFSLRKTTRHIPVYVSSNAWTSRGMFAKKSANIPPE